MLQTNLVEITQSEPVKKRGRPTVNSEQLAEYTPTRFHKVNVLSKFEFLNAFCKNFAFKFNFLKAQLGSHFIAKYKSQFTKQTSLKVSL